MAELVDLNEWMKTCRRDLHANPEFGFEETRTADFVAKTLRSFGIEVATGIGGTGVVGTLKRGSSKRSVALRADMDALHITETSNLPWMSKRSGTMHACGHDGHTVMLLGAARLLSDQDNFDGTVRFVFQPAEETARGAEAMLSDHLLSRFPFDEIYAIHNLPGLAVGHVETRAGALMAAEDNFEIVLRGKGGHASQPQWGRETLVAACSLVMDLQTIVSRRINPAFSAVVSVTELATDGLKNVLPGESRIRGDARSFDQSVSTAIEEEMRRIVKGKTIQYAVESEVRYTHECAPLINDVRLAAEAFAAASSVSTKSSFDRDPIAASEDFSRFLEHVPGCYLFIGNGLDSAPLHNPSFDFNDAALLHGANIHFEIVKRRLPIA